MVDYADLFDMEQRPGSGLELWTSTVERQLDRVRDANYRHRLHARPPGEEQEEHPTAEAELHSEIYFLVLAIRRLLLFTESLAGQLNDERLDSARRRFDQQAPNAKKVRNFFEHIDEYLLDAPGKHMKEIAGRASPVLISRWDCDNVVIAIGTERFDVTLAALAAIELGKEVRPLWDEELERIKAGVTMEIPSEDDGIPRVVEVELGTSAIIEGDETTPTVERGCLRDVRLREIDPEEAERLRAREVRRRALQEGEAV